jgi:hypothetical protein
MKKLLLSALLFALFLVSAMPALAADLSLYIDGNRVLPDVPPQLNTGGWTEILNNVV